MHKILVEGIKLYAYHGCLEEEAVIGGEYIVEIVLETDFTEAAQTDNLSKTIDYVTIYTIVRTQMEIRSKLIEHVAQRILDAIQKEFPALKKTEVKVTKLNPPMNGHVERVSVVVIG